MLVLTRKLGEKVIIDRDITVTLVAMDQGRVRLGFEAPRHVHILRGELDVHRDGRKELGRALTAKRVRRRQAHSHADLLAV